MSEQLPHDPNPNALWARVIVEELVRGGLRDVCISPGSRSTPLTLAFADHPEVRAHSHIDERSSAFFALGVARQTGRPVALVCTSGSAGAHYLPAVIEANMTRDPLIVLTADRPIELMACGSGQTISQQQLYGDQVRLMAHLETPDLDPLALRHLRFTLARALHAACGRPGAEAPGPVHLNVPMKEPLAPLPTADAPDPKLATLEPLAALGRPDAPLLTIDRTPPAPPERALALITDALSQAVRPLVVVGPQPPDPTLREALLAIAARGVPTLADPVSQLRVAHAPPTLCWRYDTWLRGAPVRAALAPDVIVRFGAYPTSKVYRFWREAHPETLEILVDAHGAIHDPTQQAAHLIIADPVAVARQVAARLPDAMPQAADWRVAIARQEEAARAAIEGALAEDEPLWEGPIARAVLDALPEAATLLLASSMPIRDADTFGPLASHAPRVLSNRGANGIDGLIATTLGAASHADGPTVALLGDVAFLHDVSSLLAASRCRHASGRPLDVTFVVVNNGGGGIFSYLPIAQFPDHFDEHFLTTHAIDLAPLCAAYGVAHTRTDTLDGMRALLPTRPAPGVRVVEVMVSREHNVARHRALWQDAIACATAALPERPGASE